MNVIAVTLYDWIKSLEHSVKRSHLQNGWHFFAKHLNGCHEAAVLGGSYRGTVRHTVSLNNLNPCLSTNRLLFFDKVAPFKYNGLYVFFLFLNLDEVLVVRYFDQSSGQSEPIS